MCQNFEGKDWVGDESVAYKCANLVGLEWDVHDGIGDCVNGDEGKQLLEASISRILDLNVT